MALSRLNHRLVSCRSGSLLSAALHPTSDRWRLLPLLLGLLLLVGVASLRAAYPPVLVIDGVAVAGAVVTVPAGSTSRQYLTPGGLYVVLRAENGGYVTCGSTLADAMHNPTNPATRGTWDGGLTASLPGHTLVIPQVLVYYGGTTASAPLKGYNGATVNPVCNTTIGSAVVQAYNGLPNNDIFTIGTGHPIYRYVVGPTPLTIHAEQAWPPSSVITFPQTLTVDSSLVNSTAFNEGITQGTTPGYWANAYYGTGTGSNTADIHVFIAGNNSMGSVWGSGNTVSFSYSLNPTDAVFTSQDSAGVTVTAPTTGPLIGPPQVGWNGVVLPFAYSSIGSGGVYGGDVYYDQQSNSVVVILGDGTVTASQPYSTVTGGYDPGSQTFWTPGLVGVSADGQSFVGISGGVTVITTGWYPGEIVSDYGGTCDGMLYRADGTALFHYSFNDTVIQFSTSPIYIASSVVDASGMIDATGGWPAPGIMQGFNPPGVYFDGQGTYLIGCLTYVYGGYIETDAAYATASGYVTLFFDFDPVSGNHGGSGIYSSNGAYYDSFGFSFDLDGAGGITNLLGDRITGDASAGPPHQGPPRITWNGVSFPFSYTDPANTDWYADTNGDYVTITTQGAVTANGSASGWTGGSGSYDSQSDAFNFGGDPNLQNFAAQDINGELLGTPGGLNLYFMVPNYVQSLQLGDGTFRDASNTTVYTFTRLDGSYGVQYVGLPVGSLFIVQDQNGNYSPVYRYAPGGDGFPVDFAANGNYWPASNLYPDHLYVNGVYTQLDGSSISEGWLQGSASYHILPANGHVNIAWSWGSGGFSATVDAAYGSFTGVSGTWDGTLFNGLPDGLVITATRPPNMPAFGPPQISWNGVVLSYDPLASSVSGSNPTGADVYRDGFGLGMKAVIQSDGTTTFTNSDGTQFVGTYSPTAGTFVFTGTSPGTANPLDSQGAGGPANPVGQSTQTSGNFSILGNYLTLGTWIVNNNYANALSISYVDAQGLNPSQIRFASSHRLSEWVWSEATADNQDPQVLIMKLDSTHKLILHDTSGSNAPGITLDPAGPSKFKQPILVAPQGDLSMGEFTSGDAP